MRTSIRGAIGLIVGILATMAVLLGFVGCASPKEPSAYVWTDAKHLVTLTWNEQNENLSGDSTSISYSSVAFPSSTQPDVVMVAFSGSELGNSVTLDIGGEHVTGTLAPDAGQLSVAFALSASGQIVHQTWVAVAAEELTQLVAAFSAYNLVQGWLDGAKREATESRMWSDPNTEYLAQVQQSESLQQRELAAIATAPDETTRCWGVARFQPLAASAFTLPETVAQDGTLHDVAMLDRAWQRAQRVVIPHITGLTLPWVIAPSVYQHENEPVAALVAHIQASYRQDGATMQRLQMQDQHIAQQVTVLGRGCPPMPA